MQMQFTFLRTSIILSDIKSTVYPNPLHVAVICLVMICVRTTNGREIKAVFFYQWKLNGFDMFYFK